MDGIPGVGSGHIANQIGANNKTPESKDVAVAQKAIEAEETGGEQVVDMIQKSGTIVDTSV